MELVNSMSRQSTQTMKTKRSDIAKYWGSLYYRHLVKKDLPNYKGPHVDSIMVECFSCGRESSKMNRAGHERDSLRVKGWDFATDLNRCHLVPASAGGKDEPSNYVLMCDECHDECPDCVDIDLMLNWINKGKNRYTQKILTSIKSIMGDDEKKIAEYNAVFYAVVQSGVNLGSEINKYISTAHFSARFGSYISTDGFLAGLKCLLSDGKHLSTLLSLESRKDLARVIEEIRTS